MLHHPPSEIPVIFRFGKYFLYYARPIFHKCDKKYVSTMYICPDEILSVNEITEFMEI